jgi:cell division protein FtsI/penicillin-binding protein 2
MMVGMVDPSKRHAAARPVHARRRLVFALLGAMVVVAAGVVAAFLLLRPHKTKPPGPVAAAFLAAWGHQDWPAMVAMVDQPPATFSASNQDVLSSLQVSSAIYQPGATVRHGSSAQVAFTARLNLKGLGAWEHPGTLPMRLIKGHWLVEWSTAVIDPALPAGGHLTRERSWPARGEILGANGTVLTPQASLVGIGLQGSRIKDPAQVTGALTGAGADPAKVTQALGQAAAHPDQYVPILNVPDDARYETQLRPALFPVPGIIFRRTTARQALTPDLAAHVVGSTGAITAEELTSLGSPYLASDIVGQTGIEGAFERQLAGTPGGRVLVTDAEDKTVATATTFTAKPGVNVQTTIDPHVENAAEHALDGVTQPAAFVAVQASTGAVLAAVSRPTAMAFDRALEGRYPPGSTFKVITAADLLASGLTPGSPATCPATITVGGRTFHNFEGEGQPTLPLHQAFAISCNTAFIGLARNVTGSSLMDTAAQFGFGSDPNLGLPAFGGRAPAPKDAADQAAAAIGQSTIQASPLQMAAVAAAVDSGAYRPPRLVAGSADDKAAPMALAPGVVSGLRSMMAEVTVSGTGKAAAVPGKPAVSGKTGTAEFGNATPPATHAWFIGYQGDVAFAVLVEGGGVGGTVAAPIAGRFVAGL